MPLLKIFQYELNKLQVINKLLHLKHVNEETLHHQNYLPVLILRKHWDLA